MAKKIDKINKRKKEINDLCSELKWVYRGYYTRFIEFFSFEDINNIEKFCRDLLNYNKSLKDKEYELYYSFLISSICFIRKYCRNSDLIFYSLVKIAITIEDCAKANINFGKSTYGYMWEPYLNNETDDETENMGIESAREFSKLYDDKNLEKNNFATVLISLFDELLFDNNKSFILDSNYEIATSSINRFIGQAKYSLKKSLAEDVDND